MVGALNLGGGMALAHWGGVELHGAWIMVVAQHWILVAALH